MEFFKEVKKNSFHDINLEKKLTINNLPMVYKSINTVISDKQQHDEDFIASIEEFMSDWEHGILSGI